MKVFEKEYSIYCIFLVFSILSWLSILHVKKILLMIEQPLSLVMFMSFVKFIIILSIVLSGAIVSPSTILKDIKIIKPADIALLILIAIIFTIGRILFSTLLKHHDPRTIKISGYMISTVVSGGALYVMKRKNFTTSRYVGFALMALGGFLYIN